MTLETIHTGFEQIYRFGGAPFHPRVAMKEKRGKEANVVLIHLDASPYAPLKWASREQQAQNAIAEGHLLMWELDMGLFGRLPFDLEDEAQLLSLELGIDHFKKHLLGRYAHATFGVVLYRGSIALSSSELDYLKLLAAELPEFVSPFLLLDGREEKSPSSLFAYATREQLEHFHLAIKSPLLAQFPWALPALCWEEELLRPCAPSQAVPLGVCLSGFGDERVDEILQSIHIPFRILPEEHITHLWEGLDELVVFSHLIGEQGRRKLLGFCAAGGTVLTVGDPLDLPKERSFSTRHWT